MNRFYTFVLGMLIAASCLPAFGAQPNPLSVEAALQNADARQAIAIANQLKWSRPEARSYVTPQEVVIELKDRTFKFDLPADKMYIAVAPYINNTHK